MSTSIELSGLALGRQLGKGGQGTVYAIESSPNVVKLYAAGQRIKTDVLQSLPDAFGSLPLDVRDRVAAPLQVVTKQNQTIGFTMPAIGADFSFTTPDGTTRLYDLQHLLNGHEYAISKIPGLSGYTQAASYRLLADLAGTLQALHQRGIVVGDISPRNLLFSLSGEPRMLIIDADSMVVNGRSVFSDHVETSGWEAPEVKSLPAATRQPTVASDRYKFGLLALRLIAGDQEAKTPAAIPQQTPPMLRTLITGALSAAPGDRPSLTAWQETLSYSAQRATFWVADPKSPTPSGVASSSSQANRSGPSGSTSASNQQPLSSIFTGFFGPSSMAPPSATPPSPTPPSSTPPSSNSWPPAGAAGASPYQGSQPLLARRSPPSSRVKDLFSQAGARGWVLVCGLAAAVVVAMLVLANQTSTPKSSPSASRSLPAVGTCVSAYDAPAACGSTTPIAFIVAAHRQSAADCGRAGYRFNAWQPDGTLCLVPDYQVGECYEMPPDNGKLFPYNLSTTGCDARTSTNVRFRVTGRSSPTDPMPSCSPGSDHVHYFIESAAMETMWLCIENLVAKNPAPSPASKAAYMTAKGRVIDAEETGGGKSCNWLRLVALTSPEEGPYGTISNELVGRGCVNLSHAKVIERCNEIFNEAGECAFWDPDNVLNGKSGDGPVLILLRESCLKRAGQTDWALRGVSDGCVAVHKDA